MTTISASEHPNIINAVVADLMSDNVPPDDVVKTETTELPYTSVRLEGGLPLLDGSVASEAEVRELNGEDEEYIAKTNGTGKMLNAILSRGVVRIGDERATGQMLDSLLSGDRDELLLAIRKATFGQDVGLSVSCPHCQTEQEVTIDLDADVPRKRLKDNQRNFEVMCRVGPVEVGLPTGAAQRKMLDAIDKTNAELNTMLLESCVAEINGQPVIGPDQVRRLSLRDRDTIITEIAERMSGPRLSEVTKECTSCEREMSLPLSMAGLFRF